jgi:hypothetical protein
MAARSSGAESAAMPRPICLPASLLVFAGSALAPEAAAKIYVCEKGAQDRPCDERSESPPRPPPPKLTCKLDAVQLKNAVNSERQFLTRYSEEATHRRAQLADLKPVVDRIGVGHKRFYELAAERRPSTKEAAFYASKADASLAEIQDRGERRPAHGADRDPAGARTKDRRHPGPLSCERDLYGKLWTGAAAGSSACDRPACAPS